MRTVQSFFTKTRLMGHIRLIDAPTVAGRLITSRAMRPADALFVAHGFLHGRCRFRLMGETFTWFVVAWRACLERRLPNTETTCRRTGQLAQGSLGRCIAAPHATRAKLMGQSGPQCHCPRSGGSGWLAGGRARRLPCPTKLQPAQRGTCKRCLRAAGATAAQGLAGRGVRVRQVQLPQTSSSPATGGAAARAFPWPL